RVEARPFRLRHVAEPAWSLEAAARGRELAEQDVEERRLPAAVWTEHADALAAPDVKGHVLEHERPAVRRCEPFDVDERPAQLVHRCLPPVMPRTMASAFARSIARYVAPGEPAGPSVSP